MRNIWLFVALLFAGVRVAQGQSLVLKRTLTTGAAAGCPLRPAAPLGARRDNAEARRLSAAGQEAALIGDRAAARTAFAQAAALNPGDERIAYDLGRAHEELADTTSAIAEFCRYLALSSDGREAPDVRTRLSRLTPPTAIAGAQRAQQSFALGLKEFDAQRYGSAANAFGEVVRLAPGAPEAVFDRALSKAAADERSDAVRDLETYLVSAPAAPDRPEVLRAIEALRRPVYDPGKALSMGILPGFGQFYTGRPGRGILALTLVAGSVGAAAYQRTETREVPYIDPNGVPVPFTVTTKSRPYATAGIAGAVALTLAAAIEARWFAARSRAGIARVTPYLGERGESGFALGIRF